MPHFEELFAEFYEQGTPSSAVAWGDITGTLSDQTDLQAALDAKLDDSQAAAFGLTLLATATAADARTALALVPGTDVQPYDADLTALAGLATAADTLPYFTGSATAALTGFTAFARTLLDDTTALAMRATLGLVIGTDVQAQDAELQAIAGLTSAADQLPYFTGSGTAALTTLTSFARTLIDDTTAANARTTLGLGTADSPTFAALTVTGLSTLATLVNTGALQATKTGASAITPQWQMNGSGVTNEATGSTIGLNRWSANTGSPALLFSKSRGAAVGTHTAVAANDILGRLGFNGSDGTAFFEGARIEAFADATIGAGSVSGRLVFSTTAAAGGSATTALTLNADQSAAFAAHVNAPTTMVIGNTAAIPANCRVLIDGTGSGTLPTLSGGTSLALQRNNATGNNNFLAIIAGTAGIAAVRFGDSGSATQGRIDYDNTVDAFNFYTSATLALTITNGQALQAAGAFSASSGAFNNATLRSFVVDGTAITPPLQVNGTTLNTSSAALARWSATAIPTALVLAYSAGAAVGTHGVVANTNILGKLSFNGSDGAAFIEAARIEAFVNGTPGTNDMPGGLRFLVTPDGSATAAAALTINQDKTADFASSLTTVGGTSSARWLVNYASAVLGIATTADAQTCGTFLYSAGSVSANRRWGVVKNNTSETGANAGSDFEIWNYDDSGTLIGTALSIARASGLVTLSGLLTGANLYNTYTPTLTGITNVASSSANVSGWIRIGNAVLVFAQISVTATASGANTVIDVSIPVASNFGATTQCVGVGSLVTAATEVAAVGITANATNDRARATFVSTSTNARTYTLVFGYIVI